MTTQSRPRSNTRATEPSTTASRTRTTAPEMPPRSGTSGISGYCRVPGSAASLIGSPRSSGRLTHRIASLIGSPSFEEIAQTLRVAVTLELGQGLGFDLTDALAGDAELLAHLFEGARALALEPEAQLDHLALAMRESREDLVQLLFLHDLAERFDRHGGLFVFDEVAELGVLFFADRRFEADRLLADLQDLAHLLGRRTHLGGDLIGGRLAAHVLEELALHADQLVDGLDHVHRDTNGASLVGDGARDRLADPPGGVGRELVALAVVELLDRTDEAEVALLDQVEEQHAATDVALGDRHHEAQVGFDQLALGLHVAALDALGQRDLFFGREQRP